MKKGTDSWKWCVMVATYVGATLMSTCTYGVGALYVDLLDRFRGDEFKTSIAGTLNITLICFLAPFSGALCNKFGCRTPMVCGGLLLGVSFLLSVFATSVDVLIVTYGLLGGIGNSLAFIPLTIILGYYFDKNIYLIISMVTGFSGFGLFLSTPFTLAILEQYGVSGGFMIFGGVFLNMCVVGCICRPSDFELAHVRTRRDNGRTTEKGEHLLSKVTHKRYNRCFQSLSRLFNVKLLLKTDFLAFLISTISWTYFLAMCQLHLPNFLTKGFHADANMISVIMLVFGISNTIGRLSAAAVVSVNKADPVGANAVVLIVCGVYMVLFPLFKNVIELTYLLTVITGFGSGFCNGLMSCIALRLLGLDEFASSNGLVYLFIGIGTFLGPVTTGYMVDTFVSYDNSFILAGSIALIGGGCSFYTMTVQRCKLRSNLPSNNTDYS